MTARNCGGWDKFKPIVASVNRDNLHEAQKKKKKKK